MKHNLYSIYDVKADAYLPPFTLHQDGMAVRAFRDCCNDDTHNFGKNPGDYTLFKLGEFDDQSGLVTSGINGAPLKLHCGIELLDQHHRADRISQLTADDIAATLSPGGTDPDDDIKPQAD